MPVSGPTTDKYGGRTLCIDIDAGADLRVIIDGGTGISALAQDLVIPPEGIEFHVFLTHYHWDHLQGILFFPPLYDERNRFTFYGHSWNGMGSRKPSRALSGHRGSPFRFSRRPPTRSTSTLRIGPSRSVR
jgi:phosphoribosyl 1,2-cyclic phosphodiesterase